MEFIKLSILTPQAQQSRVARNLAGRSGLLAYHGIGSGKTFTSIHSGDKLKLPILAIVPAALRNNYKKEIEAADFKNESRVVSYDEALKKSNDPEFRDFASRALVVYDEAHRMGQVTSKRSKLPQMIPSKKNLSLTATPIRNKPSEIAPLINAVSPGSLPDTPEAFDSKFIQTREVPVGFWGRMKGIQPGTEQVPVNLREFRNAVKGKVDFFSSADRSEYPSFDETVHEVPMSNKQQASYNWVMGKYPTLAYRIKHGLPMGKDPSGDFKAFMMGPRQVSNNPATFNRSAADSDSPKVQAMANEIEQRYKKDKNFRGVAYSSFLDAGILPLSRELKRRGIAHDMFTGESTDRERSRIVSGYNAGKTPVLLLSGAGAEGLDLKGTKLMQIMEPHWQEELVDQVRGRAIRYKSHAHLPEGERHVEVQRYHAVPQLSMWDKVLGRKRSKETSIDEYVYNTAKKKRAVNQQFLDVLKEGDQADEKKLGECGFCGFIPDFNQLMPGLLVDLDGTLVGHPDGTFSKELGRQFVLPGRIEILKKFKAAGYTIVGVTNRSIYKDEDMSPETLRSMNRETMDLMEGLLDDVIFMAYGPTEFHKPAPTMLLYAMSKYNLDPENTVYVGDMDDDKNAAQAANLPFVWATDFFDNETTFSDVPDATPRIVDPSAEEEELEPLDVEGEDKTAAPKFDRLKEHRTKLTDEERQTCLTEEAVWHHGPNGEPSPAVWKSVVDGETYYVTNTHRAYQVRPTLKGAVSIFKSFIKETA